MLLIVDTNCISKTLCASPSDDFRPVLAALRTGKKKIAVGGTKLKQEYARLKEIWGYLISLEQAGRAVLVLDRKVDEEQAIVEKSLPLVSDDPHIIALARVSGARLLCSHDKALHQDFTNVAIVPRPKGKVYQDAHHAHLLTR